MFKSHSTSLATEMETSVSCSWKAESWGLRSSLSCNGNATPEKTEPSYLAISLYNDGALVGKEWGLPRWLTGKKKIPSRKQGFDTWVRKIPWRRGQWECTLVFLPGKIYGQLYSSGSQRVRCDCACTRFIYLDGDICDNAHKQLKSLCAPKHPQTAEIWITIP